jgi:hypothetical protein
MRRCLVSFAVLVLLAGCGGGAAKRAGAIHPPGSLSDAGVVRAFAKSGIRLFATFKGKVSASYEGDVPDVPVLAGLGAVSVLVYFDPLTAENIRGRGSWNGRPGVRIRVENVLVLYDPALPNPGRRRVLAAVARLRIESTTLGGHS